MPSLDGYSACLSCAPISTLKRTAGKLSTSSDQPAVCASCKGLLSSTRALSQMIFSGGPPLDSTGRPVVASKILIGWKQ
jgi:hypothetical protein